MVTRAGGARYTGVGIVTMQNTVSMLPLERRRHFIVSSAGLPRPPEGGKPYRRGSLTALVIESRHLVVMIQRAAPVIMIDGTDFLELAALLMN